MSVNKLFSSDFKKRYQSTIPLVLALSLYLFVGCIATAWSNLTGIDAANVVFILLNYFVLGVVIWEIMKAFDALKWPWIVIVITALLMTFLYFLPLNRDQQVFYFYNQINWFGLKTWMIILMYVIVAALFFLFPLLSNQISFQKVFLLFLFLLYINLAIKSFNQFMLNDIRYGWTTFLWLFMIPVLNDTFAFLGGISFGKHKMAPSISPKKSWEGFIIGCVIAGGLATMFAILMANFAQDPNWVILRNQINSRTARYITYAALSCLFAICAVIGDLWFSATKRVFGIKDFSNLIPGHGGMSDRLDSVFLVFFVMFVISTII